MMPIMDISKPIYHARAWNRLYRPTRVEAIHAAEIAICYLPSPLNKLEKTEKLFWCSKGTIIQP